MGSFLAAEERSLRKNVGEILKFLAGRLTGYLGFGLLAGVLGERFDSRWLRLATSFSFIILSVILCGYLLGLLRREKSLCPSSIFFKSRSPFLLGFFMGINLCPPFLLSITYVFSRHSALYGMVYFALFFLASSLYFLPIVFVGLASRAKEFRTVARAS
ncbi:MAG: sulfite exporter TauE/SafE family protein, partial [Chloroflexota bacterium]